MTRTSLFKLADEAELWALRVPASADIRLDVGAVLRFGANSAPEAVAEVILRYQLGHAGTAPVDEQALQAALERHGYGRPGLRSAEPVKPATRRACGG